MGHAAIIVGGLTLAFWLGAALDHVVFGCKSNRCLLRFLVT